MTWLKFKHLQCRHCPLLRCWFQSRRLVHWRWHSHYLTKQISRISTGTLKKIRLKWTDWLCSKLNAERLSLTVESVRSYQISSTGLSLISNHFRRKQWKTVQFLDAPCNIMQASDLWRRHRCLQRRQNYQKRAWFSWWADMINLASQRLQDSLPKKHVRKFLQWFRFAEWREAVVTGHWTLETHSSCGGLKRAWPSLNVKIIATQSVTSLNPIIYLYHLKSQGRSPVLPEASKFPLVIVKPAKYLLKKHNPMQWKPSSTELHVDKSSFQWYMLRKGSANPAIGKETMIAEWGPRMCFQSILSLNTITHNDKFSQVVCSQISFYG